MDAQHVRRRADVNNHIPYQGKVEVNVKQAVDLSLRIPEWAAPSDTRGQVNGQDRAVGWDGRYALLGVVQPGVVATLTFPIPTRSDIIHVEKARYTVVRKGNEVIEIDPPGRYSPLYQRAHYRGDVTCWRAMERFVSEEEIYW